MIYVIIPTYNEVDNVKQLAEKLFELKKEMTLVFVDDSSPDGTAEAVKEIIAQNTHVHLIERLGKGGRGGACMVGFQWVVDRGLCTGDIVVEMDADLSHDPLDLEKLLEKVNEYDLVVGSRYVDGGVIKKWPWGRLVLSKYANLWAKWVLGIPMKDYTTGFRAYKGELFEHFDWHRIHSRGYIVLTEMAWQVHRNGFRITEVPITFVNRVRGDSNLSLGEVVSAFTSVLRLKFENEWQRK